MKINTLNIKKDFTIESRAIHNGYQVIFMFSNGYGASVVEHDHSKGLEIVVLDSNKTIIYNTPITDDVLGHLTDEEANTTLERISKL